MDAEEQSIEQYLLAAGEYRLSVKIKDGVIHSRAMKGLVLPVRAAFDPKENLKALAAIVSG